MSNTIDEIELLKIKISLLKKKRRSLPFWNSKRKMNAFRFSSYLMLYAFLFIKFDIVSKVISKPLSTIFGLIVSPILLMLPLVIINTISWLLFESSSWATDSLYERIDNEINKIKKEIKFIQSFDSTNNIEISLKEKLADNFFINSSNNLTLESESKFLSDENILSIKNSGQPLFNSELLNIEKKEIGLAGEFFVLNYEKEYLTKNGRSDLANKVKHASLEIGDGLGYDIISYSLNGDKKYIEVKSTKGSVNTSFFISRNELIFFSTQPNVFIYRVYKFNKEKQNGELNIIGNNDELLNKNIIVPSNYIVTPKTS